MQGSGLPHLQIQHQIHGLFKDFPGHIASIHGLNIVHY